MITAAPKKKVSFRPILSEMAPKTGIMAMFKADPIITATRP